MKTSIKNKAEFSDAFTTDFKEKLIIPLVIDVCNSLNWTITYVDKHIVEAERAEKWEKLTITKSTNGHIDVHSTIEGNDEKKENSAALFIAQFQKLASRYKENTDLEELTVAYEKEQSNWSDYEVPRSLPSPTTSGVPNMRLTMIGGFSIAVIFGILLGVLTINVVDVLGLFELVIAHVIYILFSKANRKLDIIDTQKLKPILVGVVFVMFITNLLTQYGLIITKNNIEGASFFEFIKLRFDIGLTLDTIELGWIGLVVSWLIKLIVPYRYIIAFVNVSILNHIINRVPGEVLSFVFYLVDMGKSKNQMRKELAKRAWDTKEAQDAAFLSVASISSDAGLAGIIK